MEQVQEEKNLIKECKYSLNLARRPKLSPHIKDIAQPIKLGTNIYPIEKDKQWLIVIQYEILILSNPTRDDFKIIQFLIINQKKIIENQIGQFVQFGFTLFAEQEIPEGKFVFDINFRDQNYRVQISEVSQYDLHNVAQLELDSEFLNRILNNKIQAVFYEMGLKEIDRTSKFYNFNEIFNNFVENIINKDMGFYVWKGYKTAFNICENGVQLQLDFDTCIIRQKNCFEYIQLFSSIKDARDALIGKSLISNYGNNRVWRIEDIDDNKTPESKFQNDEGVELTFIDYFQKTYNISIKDNKQPLLRVRQNGFGDVYLVPELMLVTGLNDYELQDQILMIIISQFTNPEPIQRSKVISTQMSRMLNSLSSQGIVISNTAPTVDGHILYTPQLLIGNNKLVNIPQNAMFMLKDKVHSPMHLKNWVVVYCGRSKRDDDECDNFIDLLKKAALTFGMTVDEPGFIVVENLEIKTWISQINNDINKNGNPNMILTLIPKNAKEVFYKRLKEQYCQTKGIPHQYVVLSSLQKNGMAVASQLLIQMAAKLGYSIWITPKPQAVCNHTMIIGIDVYHQSIGVNKNQKLSGFVATLDKDFTQYFSQIVLQKIGVQTIMGFRECTFEALKAYLLQNQTLPETIVVYRDGVSEGKFNRVTTDEADAIYQEILKFQQSYKPKFAFILINKRINTRFFCTRSGGNDQNQSRELEQNKLTVFNPPTGTVVGKTVNDSNFDFFLCSQQVNHETITPTHYKVLRNSTDWDEEVFWQLTYFQCFNYYNFSGAMKVPAAVQYAHKLAYLVGETFKDKIHPDLVNSLFYL